MRTADIFLPALLAVTMAASQGYALTPGENVVMKLTDIDGRTLSTADGHFTTVILTTRRDADVARVVGDRTPARCLGDPKYRMITVVQFPKSTGRTMRYLLTKLALSRLNSEAQHLKPRYRAKNLTANPRQDIHVVLDFEGETASRLGVTELGGSNVFAFGPDGALRRHWTKVPDAKELDEALQ